MNRLEHLVTLKHQAVHRNPRKRKPKISRNELTKLLEENGGDWAKVAESINRSPSTVRQYMYGYGLAGTTRERVRTATGRTSKKGPQLIDFSNAPIGKFGTWKTNHVDHGRKLTLEDI